MWSDLGIKHLLALRAVAEEGTFGQAAKRLGFTQSAVSQQVATLETLVGHSLFDRPSGPRRPQLTPAGELLLKQALGLLDLVEEAERELDRFARGISGRLAVGTFQSIATRVIPAALRQLYEEAPGVEVFFLSDDLEPNFGRDSLLSGSMDLAFVVGEPGAEFDSVYLGADPHVAIVAPDFPEGPVIIDSLSGSPLVGQPAEDTCGLIIDRQLERLGVTPHYVFRSQDNGAVQGMVGAGMGVALMPLLSVDTSNPNTSIRSTVPKLEPRDLSIIWNRNKPLSPVATRFVSIVAQVCSDLLSQIDDATGLLPTGHGD